MRVEAFAVSDVGRVRTVNEDSYGTREGQAPGVAEYGSSFVVCDGMGGHQAGEVASRLAVDAFLDVLYRPTLTGTDAAQRVTTALAVINALVHERASAAPEFQGMGTTIVGVVMRGSHAVVFNVGDSRCYRVRSSRVEQLSEDHSLVNDLVHAHIITSEEARTSARKNVLTRAIGNESSVQASIKTVEIRSGDCFLLCSDGLSNLVVDAEIATALAMGSLGDACSRLVALANERGGTDNITAMAIRCISDGWGLRPVTIGLAGILAVSAITGWLVIARPWRNQGTARLQTGTPVATPSAITETPSVVSGTDTPGAAAAANPSTEQNATTAEGSASAVGEQTGHANVPAAPVEPTPVRNVVPKPTSTAPKTTAKPASPATPQASVVSELHVDTGDPVAPVTYQIGLQLSKLDPVRTVRNRYIPVPSNYPDKFLVQAMCEMDGWTRRVSRVASRSDPEVTLNLTRLALRLIPDEKLLELSLTGEGEIEGDITVGTGGAPAHVALKAGAPVSISLQRLDPGELDIEVADRMTGLTYSYSYLWAPAVQVPHAPHPESGYDSAPEGQT